MATNGRRAFIISSTQTGEKIKMAMRSNEQSTIADKIDVYDGIGSFIENMDDSNNYDRVVIYNNHGGIFASEPLKVFAEEMMRKSPQTEVVMLVSKETAATDITGFQNTFYLAQYVIVDTPEQTTLNFIKDILISDIGNLRENNETLNVSMSRANTAQVDVAGNVGINAAEELGDYSFDETGFLMEDDDFSSESGSSQADGWGGVVESSGNGYESDGDYSEWSFQKPMLDNYYNIFFTTGDPALRDEALMQLAEANLESQGIRTIIIDLDSTHSVLDYITNSVDINAKTNKNLGIAKGGLILPPGEANYIFISNGKGGEITPEDVSSIGNKVYKMKRGDKVIPVEIYKPAQTVRIVVMVGLEDIEKLGSNMGLVMNSDWWLVQSNNPVAIKEAAEKLSSISGLVPDQVAERFSAAGSVIWAGKEDATAGSTEGIIWDRVDWFYVG